MAGVLFIYIFICLCGKVSVRYEGGVKVECQVYNAVKLKCMMLCCDM